MRYEAASHRDMSKVNMVGVPLPADEVPVLYNLNNSARVAAMRFLCRDPRMALQAF